MLKHALVAIALVLGASVSKAQDLGQPLLLVASPDLKGPYHHTAVLVVPMGGQHIGFILNRATEVKLATLFPEHAPSAKVADPVFFGGPERINAIFAVVPRNPGGTSVRLFGELFVTVQAEIVDRIIEQTPNDARYFAGFVGWQPGELAAELEKGFWYTADPDAALVFEHDTATMWETLIKRLGKRLAPGEGMVEA
ncbi:MAG: YqgE/AlgH family protein [Betaproteobacteria bacterium]|nr:YqgE/AlgH family protein [Betaproteobacteria bacterium]MDH4323802.1 YqgE/AlgH family protein [Betaproteobacteria bacterium]